jgi:ketosteroid isomerase-like protein
VSQENVEIVRRMCDAYISGDVARALNSLDRKVEWRGTIGGLEEGRVAYGHTQVMEGFAESAQAWESQSLETQRFIDAGERVVVFWHEVGRGRSSAAEVSTDTAVVYTLRGGKVVGVQGYMDRAEALKAVGLEE